MIFRCCLDINFHQIFSQIPLSQCPLKAIEKMATVRPLKKICRLCSDMRSSIRAPFLRSRRHTRSRRHRIEMKAQDRDEGIGSRWRCMIVVYRWQMTHFRLRLQTAKFVQTRTWMEFDECKYWEIRVSKDLLSGMHFKDTKHSLVENPLSLSCEILLEEIRATNRDKCQ